MEGELQQQQSSQTGQSGNPAPGWQQALSDGGAGEGQQAPPAGQQQGQQPPDGQGQGQSASSGQSTPPVTPQTVQLDPGSLAQLVAAARGGGQGQHEPQLSKEELDKMFNVFNVNAKMLQEAFGMENAPPEQQVAFYNTLVQGIVRQAASVAAFQTEYHLRKLRSEYDPFLQSYQQRQLEDTKARFYTKYPNLKGLEPLLVSITDRWKSDGTAMKYKTEDEAFDALHAEAIGMLKASGLDVSALAVQQQQQAAGQQKQQTTRMPTLSGGGQGGAGDGGRGTGEKKPAWASIY